MPIVAAIVFVAIFIAAAVIGGLAVGGQDKPSSVDSGPAPASNCAEACGIWRTRAAETCRAVEQTRLKQDAADATERSYWAALAAHLALAAAAVAAAFIPIVGQAIAIALGAAAAVAAAFAAGLFGKWQGELAQANAARREEGAARARQESARTDLTKQCSEAEAAACLASATTC
jgi:hypothetical protein